MAASPSRSQSGSRLTDLTSGSNMTGMKTALCLTSCSKKPSYLNLIVVSLLVLGLASLCHGRPPRRKFSLWMTKGNDLQRKLELHYPIYLVDNGTHGKDFGMDRNLWVHQLPPIDDHVEEFQFQWVAVSKNVRYQIIASSAHEYYMNRPEIVGVPREGVVPKTRQTFSVRFPCSPEADGQTTTLRIEFRFFKGRLRRVPLFAPGDVMLQLRRRCPLKKQRFTQRTYEPECKTICGFQNRRGKVLRQKVCDANYVIRANVTREYNSFLPESGILLRIEKQYRGLEEGRKHEKRTFYEDVNMAVSSNISHCDCLKGLREGQKYLFFSRLQDNRPMFTGTSLVAVFNKKAKRVLSRLRETRTVCRNGRMVSVDLL